MALDKSKNDVKKFTPAHPMIGASLLSKANSHGRKNAGGSFASAGAQAVRVSRVVEDVHMDTNSNNSNQSDASTDVMDDRLGDELEDSAEADMDLFGDEFETESN